MRMMSSAPKNCRSGPSITKTSAASWLDGNSLTGLATLLALSYSSYLIYLIAITYFAPKRALAKRLLRYGYGKPAAQI
jgi:PST family polysaccharide transporter